MNQYQEPTLEGRASGVAVLRRPGAGPLKAIANFVRRRPLGAVGGAVVVVLILAALAAPVVAPYEPRDLVHLNYQSPNLSEGWNHWGSDQLGRDIFSRVIWGARTALFVGFAAAILGTTIGVIWGSLQGYYGGKLFDTASQRLNEMQMSIPGLVLAMLLMTLLPPSIMTIVIAIGIGYIPSASRSIRSLTLSVRENMYVDAARAIGAGTLRIVFRHIMPNTFSIYLVLLSLHVGGAIIAEASLSFLGLGAGPDIPTWGGMVSKGTSQALRGGIPWLAIIPGLAIAATVYGFNLFGDAMRDVLDPRLRGGGKR